LIDKTFSDSWEKLFLQAQQMLNEAGIGKDEIAASYNVNLELK